jgi:catechol 2,3-dioxygenase-like lactoylglutathione lyase family enzyme
MITGVAHTAVRVPDVEAAAAWYESVGLTVLSPPYRVEGDAIECDMGELVPSPVASRPPSSGSPTVATACSRSSSTRGRPAVPGHRTRPWWTTGSRTSGWCANDIVATRAELEGKVWFLTRGMAEIVALRTTWFADPHGLVFILLEKRDPEKPYFAQY